MLLCQRARYTTLDEIGGAIVIPCQDLRIAAQTGEERLDQRRNAR